MLSNGSEKLCHRGQLDAFHRTGHARLKKIAKDLVLCSTELKAVSQCDNTAPHTDHVQINICENVYGSGANEAPMLQTDQITRLSSAITMRKANPIFIP